MVPTAGTYSAAARKNLSRWAAISISSMPVRQNFLAIFHVPGHVTMSRMSFHLTVVRRYASRASTNIAVGPRTTSPLINFVTCTPRKGKSGFGTGYTKPLTIGVEDLFNVKYAPRKGMIRGSSDAPEDTARRSDQSPAQPTTKVA